MTNEIIESGIVPNSGWLLGELCTDSFKHGTITIPTTNALNSLVKITVLKKANIDTESTETICVGDTVLIKKDDLLEYSQGGKKYYLLEGQFTVGTIIGG